MHEIFEKPIDDVINQNEEVKHTEAKTDKRLYQGHDYITSNHKTVEKILIADEIDRFVATLILLFILSLCFLLVIK